MLKVAINGFGRIGRTALRLLEDDKDIEVVAINDLTDPVQLAYLYKYDSVHRTNKSKISFDEDELFVKNRRIKVYAESDPSCLPWKELGVDVVLECTGVFTSVEKCQAHIDAGAKHVIISAPAKDEAKTIVYGVNDDILTSDDVIVSAASEYWYDCWITSNYWYYPSFNFLWRKQYLILLYRFLFCDEFFSSIKENIYHWKKETKKEYNFVVFLI